MRVQAHTHTHSLANYLFNDTLVGIVLDERPIRVLLVGVLLLQPCTRTTKEEEGGGGGGGGRGGGGREGGREDEG